MDATSGLRSPKIRDYETCKVHPRKLMMTMEKQPFEDVWSYQKHGDFPAIVMLVFRTWGFITLLSTGFMRPILLVTPPRMLARHYQADITFFCWGSKPRANKFQVSGRMFSFQYVPLVKTSRPSPVIGNVSFQPHRSSGYPSSRIFDCPTVATSRCLAFKIRCRVGRGCG